MMPKVYAYQIALPRPLVLQGGVLHVREGLIIEHHGVLADCAPLPHFSTDTLAQCKDFLPTFGHALAQGEHEQLASLLFQHKLYALSFALFALLHPLDQVHPATPYQFILGTPSEVDEQISHAVAVTPGQTFKIKVGLYDFSAELALLTHLSQLPLRLILDGNQSLTYAQAQAICNIVPTTKLVYFEDPVASWAECIALHVPLGCDQHPFPQDNHKNCFKILKPTVKGLQASWLTNCILSSAFESVIGITYLNRLATAYQLPPPGTDTLKYYPQPYQHVTEFLKLLQPITL